MEILLADHQGIPDNAIVSVRAGSTRRQVPLAQCTLPLKFPTAPDALCEPLKVDILHRAATSRLVLNPHEEQYHIDFGKDDMQLRFDIRASGAFAAENASKGRAFAGKTSTKDSAAASKDYLEAHGVLRYLQGLIHAVLQMKPEDPYVFMWEQLGAGCAKKPEPSGPPPATPVLQEQEVPEPPVEPPPMFFEAPEVQASAEPKDNKEQLSRDEQGARPTTASTAAPQLTSSAPPSPADASLVAQEVVPLERPAAASSTPVPATDLAASAALADALPHSAADETLSERGAPAVASSMPGPAAANVESATSDFDNLCSRLRGCLEAAHRTGSLESALQKVAAAVAMASGGSSSVAATEPAAAAAVAAAASSTLGPVAADLESAPSKFDSLCGRLRGCLETAHRTGSLQAALQQVAAASPGSSSTQQTAAAAVVAEGRGKTDEELKEAIRAAVVQASEDGTLAVLLATSVDSKAPSALAPADLKLRAKGLLAEAAATGRLLTILQGLVKPTPQAANPASEICSSSSDRAAAKGVVAEVWAEDEETARELAPVIQKLAEAKQSAVVEAQAAAAPSNTAEDMKAIKHKAKELLAQAATSGKLDAVFEDLANKMEPEEEVGHSAGSAGAGQASSSSGNAANEATQTSRSLPELQRQNSEQVLAGICDKTRKLLGQVIESGKLEQALQEAFVRRKPPDEWC